MRTPISVFLAVVPFCAALAMEQEQPLLPEKVALRSDTMFDVVASPDNAQFLVSAGTEVRVRGMSAGQIRVEHDIGHALLDPSATDIADRAHEAAALAERNSALQLEATKQRAFYEAAQKRMAALGIKRLSGTVVSVVPDGVLFRVDNEDGSDELIALITSREGLADEDKFDVMARPTGKTYQYQSAIGASKTVRIWTELEAE